LLDPDREADRPVLIQLRALVVDWCRKADAVAPESNDPHTDKELTRGELMCERGRRETPGLV